VLLAINDSPVEAEQDSFLAEEYWREAPHHPVGDLYFEAGATFRAGPYRPQAEAGGASGDGAIRAPMPGRVTAVEVSLGAAVAKGQPLVWLEAMKMEHTISAPADGVLTQLDVTVGQQVDVGTVLARVQSPVSDEGEA
jgi:biotin carboxyl carrier protein